MLDATNLLLGFDTNAGKGKHTYFRFDQQNKTTKFRMITEDNKLSSKERG